MFSKQTKIITAEEVLRVLTPESANEAVEKAFIAHGLGQVEMPAKSYLTFEHGDLRSMPAYIHGQGMDVAGIKSVNVHPQNKREGLPTVMALIILNDPATGYPLAVMDGTFLTSLRTGAAGALAVKHLSRSDSQTIGFIGCGAQARAQLRCIQLIRRLKTARVWQHNEKSTTPRSFCLWTKETYGLDCRLCSQKEEVTSEVDILITTTPSDHPLVREVSPGTHINAIGADAKGKQELYPDLLKKARIVVDDWTQASHSGEINVALQRGEIKEGDVYAQLGEIASRKKEGRSTSQEITVFDSTGLAIQDVACGWTVYQLLGDQQLRSIDFMT